MSPKNQKMIELKSIRETTNDYEAIERDIKRAFKEFIYLPLLSELSVAKKTLQNSSYDILLEAIRSGRITFNRGIFSGRFNASISKELKRLGARWDKQSSVWRIPILKLPIDIRNTISLSESRFVEKISAIDAKLAKLVPAEISGKLEISSHFDRALWKVERDFQASVKNITVAPQLSHESRKRIADEWQNNMDKHIQDFTQKEISSLRKQIRESVYAGNRYESAIKIIRKSFDVSSNKAKFLARQETGLLMAKFKETRYQDVGVRKYKWRCIAGSPSHPVRARHKALSAASDKGITYLWSDPPVTTEPGEQERRNNPGEDFNCRCFAIPVVEFVAENFKKGK